LVLAALAIGCSSAPQADIPGPEVIRRWKQNGDYYALLEIVDACIDPLSGKKVSKADVRKYLGHGCETRNCYPGAGPKMWVYSSLRRVPYDSYLMIEFNDQDMVKNVGWASE